MPLLKSGIDAAASQTHPLCLLSGEAVRDVAQRNVAIAAVTAAQSPVASRDVALPNATSNLLKHDPDWGECGDRTARKGARSRERAHHVWASDSMSVRADTAHKNVQRIADPVHDLRAIAFRGDVSLSGFYIGPMKHRRNVCATGICGRCTLPVQCTDAMASSGVADPQVCFALAKARGCVSL